MNKVLAVLSFFAVSTVLADTLVFNRALLAGHDALAVVNHLGAEADGVKLRFLQLAPKLGRAFNVFHSKAESAAAAKHHKFMDLADGKVFLHLAGFSDCANWHATLLAVWDDKHGEVYRGFTALKVGSAFNMLEYAAFGALVSVADFVHLHTAAKVWEALVNKGLASHHLALLVHDRYLKAKVAHVAAPAAEAKLDVKEPAKEAEAKVEEAEPKVEEADDSDLFLASSTFSRVPDELLHEAQAKPAAHTGTAAKPAGEPAKTAPETSAASTTPLAKPAAMTGSALAGGAQAKAAPSSGTAAKPAGEPAKTALLKPAGQTGTSGGSLTGSSAARTGSSSSASSDVDFSTSSSFSS